MAAACSAASASGAASRSFPRPFDSRSDATFANCPRPDAPGASRFRPKPSISPGHGLSSLIFRFPPNFVRQLSIKKRRNCSNIGVAQIVAASWANPGPAAASAAIEAAEVGGAAAGVAGASSVPQGDGQVLAGSEAHYLNCDGTLAVHGGERLGRGIVTDAITTPVVNTSAYTFKNTAELLEFKEGRHKSFEYGRYGNPTTETLEEKISALEGAESTLFVASGMTASIMVFLALVPAGGHIVTTTDCYRKTRIFIQTFLPKMGISATIIDPADMDTLKAVVEKQKVSLFFTESPTNPYLRCVDIKLVSEICHSKGVLVCVDGTFASPINQKALALGADLVVHSATKYLAGHHDVIGGCISGSQELISVVRGLHHVFGAVLNSNAAYFINRGVKTLHLRIRQQNSTALRMAQLLEAHPRIVRVHYPGLPSHPEHYIAKRQMTGFGGVVSFEVDGDLATTAKFIDSLKIPYLAPSFGGCDSIVDQPTIMSYWDLVSEERAKFGIKDNLVRFSFGVEEFEDLKADILQALEKI